MAWIEPCVKNLEEGTHWELNGSLMRKKQNLEYCCILHFEEQKGGSGWT